MAFYVVHHKVRDFDAWKKVYDGFESTRKQYGIREHYALQSVDHPNDITVVGEGKMEAIQKFLTSSDLKTRMESAGVIGAPEIFVGNNKR
jgi:glycine betaine/choline ABC-type transport system substrate-binding protein